MRTLDSRTPNHQTVKKMQNSTSSQLIPLLINLTTILAFFHFLNPTNGNPELRALMDIKSALDPENKHLPSWTSDGDPCGGAFEGVACNEHREVANISLQGKGLAGKVSPAVAELKCLSGLYLHYNSLTGKIPKEIANLTELTDLYLNVNNLTGVIPTQIGTMASLQVLQLCCNQLTGSIPTEIGSLKKLGVLALKSNRLTGQIPTSLGNLGMLKRLYLSFNQLSGPIPVGLANNPSLEVLEVQNNTLSGIVPSGLKRLNERFHFDNNPGLCGDGISSLRACTVYDHQNLNQIDSSIPLTNTTTPVNVLQSAVFPLPCNQTNCSKTSSKLPQIGIVAGVIILTISVTSVIFVVVIRYRRGKQKVGNRSDTTGDDRLSIDPEKNIYKRSPSSLVSFENSSGWEPTSSARECGGACEFIVHGSSKFNLEDVESTTQHFSEVNLLGKSKFSAVYKGVLKDGSLVAVKSISKTSCKAEENEFLKGLSLLNDMKHENLVKLKGFCCSKARGECFLIYEFASKGNLAQYLDVEDNGGNVLDWPTRVSIINGIARGIKYLHSSETNKPPIIHQNISVEKVVLDQQFNPLIVDSGLLKLLADDVVYSALKVSAALGYMAPEYINTGRFTEKSDVYAFGVIILQLLSSKRMLSCSVRFAAEAGEWKKVISTNLNDNFSKMEVARLVKIASDCIHELPENRPVMESVVQKLIEPFGG